MSRATLQSSISAKITKAWSCLLIQALLGAGVAHGADNANRDSRGGWHHTAMAFRRHMSQPVGVSWRSSPTRNALQRLARTQRVAIFLDRRVDPNREIDFSVHGVSLREALQQLAQANRWGLCYVGPVVYIGPPSVTDRLPPLIERHAGDLAKQPAAMRRRMTRRQAWRWPRLSEPRQLLEQLAHETGIQIQGADQLPHDLWPAADLPPLSLMERLTLVLAGFDRTFEIAPAGAAVRVVPFPGNLPLRRAFRVPQDASKVVAELSQMCPTARFQIEDSRLIVEGRLDDLERIGRHLFDQPTPKLASDKPQTRFTLRVVNTSAEALLNRLADDLSLAIQIDPSALPIVKETISLEVTEATLDELLTAALGPLGLAYELRGSRLTIRLDAERRQS